MAAAVAGYSGAAAVTALAGPPLKEASYYGPGDGLTRYVLTADPGVTVDELVQAVGTADGVVNAQDVGDGRALVATEGLPPQHLEALPGVADAEFSTSVPVMGQVTDPYVAPYGWNLENTGANSYLQAGVADADVDAFAGWDGGTGHGRIVAVTDTGFDSDHPDLAGSLWTNPAETCGPVDRDGNGLPGDCHGWNFATNSADVDNGTSGAHGTGVSGVVGARADNGHGSAGVAPDVQIMPLVIGSGDRVDVYLAAKAIRYAVDHGADVINASWGGAFTGGALTALQSAVAYAAAHDVLIIAAAGNDALDRDRSPSYPASLPDANIVTVGNSNASDGISDSSAYGATSVDLFAPGKSVATTWNDGSYRMISGTSIAAPHVAAAVALYRAQMPAATAAEVKAALLGDVEPVAAFAGRSVTGGRLSIAALAEAGAGAVDYRFTSMTAPAGVVSPRVTAAGPTGSGDYAVTLGLGMEHDGEVWAVSGAELTVGGTTLATDDTGTARFPLGRAAGPAALALSPSMELGDGRYVLTVQLEKDGAALGRTVAAPLLVGSAAVAPSTGSGGSGTGGSGTGGTQPGTGTGSTTPGSGTSGGASTPGSPSAGGSGTGGARPGTSTPASGSSGSGSDSGSAGSGSAGSGPAGSGSAGSGPAGSGSAGSAPAGSGPDPSGSGSGGSSPDAPSGRTTPTVPDVPSGTRTPTSPEPPSGSGGPTPGGENLYPSVGPFAITSLSPSRVGTAGGTLVTITGAALPADPRVRIGDTAAATVVRSSATGVVVRVPARVAGVYDVHVFAPDGRHSVLTAALTYVAAGTGGSGTGGSAPTGTTPGSSGGTTPGSSGGTTPDGTTPSRPDTGGSVQPGIGTGPAGQRLVRSATFSGLRGIWSTDCSVSCTGVVV